MNPTITRLDKLKLTNFRCFSELEVQFHEKLTVIVAPNGGGKTALLDAINLSWHHFLQGTDWDNKTKGIPCEDDRLAPTPDGEMLARKPVIVAGHTLVNGKPVEWQIDKGLRSPQNTSAKKAVPLWSAGYGLRKQLQDYADQKQPSPPVLPVLGFYGTGRLWLGRKITEARRKKLKADTSPVSGYDDCLSQSSHFELFAVWFERFSRAAQQERETGEASPHRPVERLKVVAGAVDWLLKPTGWKSLSFDFGSETLVATHPVHGKLPVSSLSDGIRIMIGLVGDIAHRCARLNHHLGSEAARMTPGVIMIDEVDMHLHPEWQQLVLKALQDAFPLIQFIVTTHSPQVVSTAHRENIRMLVQKTSDEWEAHIPERNPYAHANSVALETVMGGHAYPPNDTVDMLREYQRLVGNDQHDAPRALELRAALEDEWGKTDPELALMDVTIRKNETLRKLRSQKL
jgi:predicted ATP-binding protein involved in virulence